MSESPARTRQTFGFGCRDVAEMPSGAVGAGHRTAVDNERATESGACGHDEDHTLAVTGPVKGLTQCVGVYIVDRAGRHPRRSGDEFGQRRAGPSSEVIGGGQHASGLRVDDTGRADADCLRLEEIPLFGAGPRC
jgi:hypothetical protein